MFLAWLLWPYFVSILTHGMFGRSVKLPPMRELAKKTRHIMNPAPFEEGPDMKKPAKPAPKDLLKTVALALPIAVVLVALPKGSKKKTKAAK
jgi:hypothetical protein